MRRRRLVLGGVAALLVAAAVAVAVVLAQGRAQSPEDAALAYLRALESGDAAAVQATGLELSEAAATAFASAVERPRDGAVRGAATVDATTASVPVSYRLAGRVHETTLALHRADGRWVPDAESALGTVELSLDVGAAVIAGDAILPVGEPVPLLPGDYEVAQAPADLLEGAAELRVSPGATSEVSLTATLRPEATKAAQRELDRHLEACTEPAATVPPQCGLRIPWGAELERVSGIRYRIERMPAITLTGTAFQATGGTLVATVSGVGHDGAERSVTYRTENWAVRGDVTFTADGLELQPW